MTWYWIYKPKYLDSQNLDDDEIISSWSTASIPDIAWKAQGDNILVKYHSRREELNRKSHEKINQSELSPPYLSQTGYLLVI